MNHDGYPMATLFIPQCSQFATILPGINLMNIPTITRDQPLQDVRGICIHNFQQLYTESTLSNSIHII